ncbi:hypothetical protein [Thauera sp.]|uniref:hypothetical protein n=1 Tax=Thauera sp. TaxID=1905334 RepID=UPI002D1FA515|nr:hypothetical protein [Thauera sp.]
MDSDYKNFFYFLINHYGKKNISENWDFFFSDPKKFSKWNWCWYFDIFCNTHKISAIFVTDTVVINNNVTKISRLGLPIISFLIHKQDDLVDYSFFFRVKGNEYYYLLASTFLNYTFFLSLHYKLNCFKFSYMKKIGYFVNHVTYEPY